MYGFFLDTGAFDFGRRVDMKVKEVLLSAADMLGVYESVKNAFEGVNAENNKETETLLRCFNLVENAVAIDYLPLKAEDVVYSDSGKIAFSELSSAPVRILGVSDAAGNPTRFSLFPDFIKTEAGKRVVLYTYAPKEKSLEDDSDFVTYISSRVLAYGVCAEYCTACGLYEQASVWDGKYKEALRAALRSTKCKVLATRRWA